MQFKAGVTKENRGKALGKGNGAEKKQLKPDDAGNKGALVLVAVEDSKGKKADRKGLKASAANIRSGGCQQDDYKPWCHCCQRCSFPYLWVQTLLSPPP